MKSKLLVTALLMPCLANSATALSRWECRGITADKIVLAPFDDGTVSLSFNGGAPTERAEFVLKGDVFYARFKDVTGVKGADLGFIIDTITRNGFEFGQQPGKAGVATKITCWWYQN